ncbi:Glutamyl-tRNA(Gln) amidotransferase subunit A [Frondihabitans sp. 762G35]|uniref:AtzH-like domain-containing protein n=1 Tax=Frondihabitans sp. 762G35 TaxID=1446794 RepID=UPI000D21AC82|nr:AtzH-like domain-containing protein [Frondihabitans sp. 762G35]ARC58497.1 Glutamyl-tRNA(Gln) amidotransferase subunit A [Frondihabitans sp. 762G35]
MSDVTETAPTTVQGELPDGLVEAFDAYERALADNDRVALAAAFEEGDETLRADTAGLLVGHEAITAFRGRRSAAPDRSVVDLHVRALGPDAALVVSVNAPAAGGQGLVTQLWRRGADGVWRIAVAQVQAPAPVFDTRIWRVVGAPLVAPAADPASSSDPADDAHSLRGETVAVKDLFAVAGHAIGAGVPAYLAEAPVRKFHAPAVQALLDAGAALLGIAQTDEFAYSIAGRNSAYGTPPNGAVPGAISGGSSSGPASAVALGHATIGLGTDTGGSIRVPASYQGLWGLRTTHGAVRRTDLVPLAPTFDTVGWLTRDADRLARAAASTLVGLTATSAFAQRPVAPAFVVDPRLTASVSTEVRAAFGSLLGSLVASGAVDRPDEVALGDIAHLYELFRTIQSAEAWRSHGDWITANPGSLAPDVESRFAFGRSVTPEREQDARVELAEQRQHLDRVLADRILLLPSASSAAPPLSATPAEFDAVRSATLGLTCIAGIGGFPAVSAPLMRVSGGPVGLCLVGPRGSDLALVEVAAGLAQALAV